MKIRIDKKYALIKIRVDKKNRQHITQIKNLEHAT